MPRQVKRLMTPLMTFWAAYSISGCGGVERPDTNVCVLNVELMHLKCYNLKRDYNDDGNLKPGAKPTINSISGLSSLNTFVMTDPDGWANLKAYIRKLRESNGQPSLEIDD